MPEPLDIAVLTVSDSRTRDNDASGQYLCEALKENGHNLVGYEIERDDLYLLRARVSIWIASPEVEVILITGGPGVTSRDSPPAAVEPLLDSRIDGFGELFRAVSYEEIGTSTLQSRAVGGMANGTLVFCIPGSPGACKTAWLKILKDQLDINHRPCNFAELIKIGSH